MARKKEKNKSASSKNSSDESYICQNCGAKVDPTRNICMRCGAFYNPIRKFLEEKYFKEQNAYFGWFAETTPFRGMSNQQIQYNEGLEHLEKMRLEEAIKYYDKETKENSNDIIAWNNLGAAYMGVKNRKYALKCYENAVELKPNYYIGLYNIGAVHYECKQYEKSIEFFDKAIEANPRCGEAHWDKHLANEELGHWDFGFTMKAMNQGINVMRAQMNRSSALVDLGNGNDAILGYRYLSLKNQNQLRKYHDEANENFEKGNFAEVLKILNKCTKLNPDDSTAWMFKGKTFLKLKKYDDAKHSFEKSLTVNRYLTESWLALGSIHAFQERLDKGFQCYTEMLRINPFDPFALKAYDAIVSEIYSRLRNQGKHYQALEFVDGIIADEPPEVSAWWVEKGTLYFLLQKFNEANKCFNKALEEDPKNYFAWLNKGGINLVQGNFKEAKECYNKVLELDPNNEKAIEMLKKMS